MILGACDINVGRLDKWGYFPYNLFANKQPDYRGWTWERRLLNVSRNGLL
jgi:hypothetical protein